MSFGKDSSIVFAMDGDKLIGIGRTDITADKQSLDTIESEVMRIVNDYQRLVAENNCLKKSNERLKKCKLQIKKIILDDSHIPNEVLKIGFIDETPDGLVICVSKD